MTPKKQLATVSEKTSAQNYFTVLVGLVLVVCLAAGLALAFASESMDAIQRWVLIFFMMAFSVCGLIFSLFGATASEWLSVREWRKIKALENRDKTAWDVRPAQSQRRKLTSEVKELAAILDVPDENLSDLLSAYIVAEDLALRQVQQEEKALLMRHITVGSAEFDGILVKDELITCIDVTFLVTPQFSKEKADAVMKKIETARQVFEKIRPESKVKLLLIFVTQLEKRDLAQLRSTTGKKMFPDAPVDIEIRLKDFEELQKIYAL
jgi:hypothetical protein